MILWDGFCDGHNDLSADEREEPNSTLIAHPNYLRYYYCRFMGSATAMLNYTKNSDSKKFNVVTKTSILQPIQKDSHK